jgi:hypothetical protein
MIDALNMFVDRKRAEAWADHILVTVSPLIRQQVAEEIAEGIDEKAEQIRRDAWTPSVGLALAAIMTDAAAIARSHAQHPEEKP